MDTTESINEIMDNMDNLAETETSPEVGDVLSERELFKLVQNLPQGKSLLDICREVAEARKFLVLHRKELEALMHAPALPATPVLPDEKHGKDRKNLPPRSLEELKAEFTLVYDPKQAIQPDKVVCCLCGKEVQSLTSRHFNTHGISVEEYKLLCGYEPDTVLMSAARYEHAQQAVVAAQSARKSGESEASLAEQSDDSSSDKKAAVADQKEKSNKQPETKASHGKEESKKAEPKAAPAPEKA